MTKLQLYIYKSLRGFKCVQNINPAENIQRHIRDTRSALELISYEPSEKYLFYLLSYIKEGTLLTILRTIPEVKGDHLQCTIFIPNGIVIDRSELADVVSHTARMISNSAVSDDEINELYEVFAREYPIDEQPPHIAESMGREYAFTFYGGDTDRDISDIFTERFYQPQFIDFAGVLWVDAELGVDVDASDLTDRPLMDPAVLFPPEPSDGFTPFIYDRTFDVPFRSAIGMSVEVEWRRKGFNPIVEIFEVDEPEITVPATGKVDDSRKAIDRQTFHISSHGGKNVITDVDITVNGTPITGEHLFSYDELKTANVVVRARGFRPYQATLNLAATSQALISLHEQKRIFGFELPVKSSELGAPIRFEIHTKRNLTESPLEGYSLVEEMREGSGKFNHLHYTGAQTGVSVKMTVIYIVAALLAGFLLGWAIMGRGKTPQQQPEQIVEQTQSVVEEIVVTKHDAAQAPSKDSVEQQPVETPQPEPPVQTAQPAKDVNAETIAYLESNAKWTRDEMEKQAGLAGLFDDMNNFRLERITTHWAPLLKDSKRFEKVAYHAGESLRKKIFNPQGTYCKSDNDNSITVQSYLNKIDPAKR